MSAAIGRAAAVSGGRIMTPVQHAILPTIAATLDSGRAAETVLG